MIQKLWLYPPLALARVGPSKTPCDSFHWGPNDLRPRGTGKTTIVPAESLHLSPDGTITSAIPTQIKFKDSAGWKPVCPFFELHGTWSEDGKIYTGPITPQILNKFGKSAHDLKWKIEVANLKAFHFTQIEDDMISATVQLDGDYTQALPLKGVSPANAKKPLIPIGQYLSLGSIQLSKPTEKLPTFRLRFTPASGWVYGPSDLKERTDGYRLPVERLIINPEANWCNYRPTNEDQRTVPQGEYAVSNVPDNVIDGDLETYWETFGKGSYIQADMGSPTDLERIYIAWYRGNLRQSNFDISVSDDGNSFRDVFTSKSSGKTVSLEQYEFPKTKARFVRIIVRGNTENDWAAITEISINEEDQTKFPINRIIGSEEKDQISLGLVDDVCDGIISCSLEGISTAFARIAVGPPKYDPDRRHFTSLADGLTDRMRRTDVRDPIYLENHELTTLEICDFLERVLETVELTNIDAQNDRIRRANRSIAQDLGLDLDEAANKVFPEIASVVGRPFPLTELGRQNHRRFVSMEVFEDMLRERPDLIENYIRKPMTEEIYYDRKMPFAMRGSDGGPLHITRRQYDLLVAYQKRLIQEAEAGT